MNVVFIRQTSVKFARLYHLYLQLYNQNNVLASWIERMCDDMWIWIWSFHSYTFLEFYYVCEGRCFICESCFNIFIFHFASTFYVLLFYLLYVAQIEQNHLMRNKYSSLNTSSSFTIFTFFFLCISNTSILTRNVSGNVHIVKSYSISIRSCKSFYLLKMKSCFFTIIFLLPFMIVMKVVLCHINHKFLIPDATNWLFNK